MRKREQFIIGVSLLVSILLAGVKFLAYLTTRSVAILSDALESLINIAAAGFASYSIWYSSKPRDRSHPYGHGKVEFFSLGAEGTMIFLAGFLILFKAVQYYLFPRVIQGLDFGIILIGSTGLVNLLLGLFLTRSGKTIPSIPLYGNGQHILTDAYSTFGLVLALFLMALTGWGWIDPTVSVLVAVLVLRKGVLLIRKSVSGLMDEADLKVASEIIRIVESVRKDSWVDIHNLRIQRYGSNIHLDCHLTLPYYLTLAEGQEQIRLLASEINRHLTFGQAECFIQTDPCIPSSCPHCRLRECPVRKQSFTGSLVWNKDNVLQELRHGELPALPKPPAQV